MHKYYLIYKPYGVLSQFSPEGDHLTLASLGKFPKDVYPVGRLDSDSEGALLLTNDTFINKQLLDPVKAHFRTYWVQVEGIISDEALERLRVGVTLRIDGKAFVTRPAQVRRLDSPEVPPRNPPIRVRQTVPDSWIELSLCEGKNRQVRRMTAAVGFPTLRLIRRKIEDLCPMPFESGTVVELSAQQVYTALKLKQPKFGK